MVYKNVFLNIAGFTIGVRLHKTKWPFYIEWLFEEKVLKAYMPFMRKKNPSKVDHWIEFVNYKNFEVIVKTGKKRHYINIYEETKRNTTKAFYHISDAQLRVIMRTILQKLLTKHKGILLHASASLVNGSAYVFMGKSGAGKSTTVSLLSSRYESLADDIIILKQEKDGFYFYMIPFGVKKEYMSDKIPLGKICFIKKADFYSFKKIKNKEYITKLISEQLFTEEIDSYRQLQYLLDFVAHFNEFYYLYSSLKDPNKLLELVK